MLDIRKRTVVAAAAIGLFAPASAMAATIDGGSGSERLRGTSVSDKISGNGGNDRIFGFGGDDALNGGSGNDRIFGGSGNDKLFGGDSADRVYGGSGNDVSEGQNGNDRMAGGSGDDVQNGGAGNDVIYANTGVDTSTGGDGDDVLWALARTDVTPGPNGEVDQVGDTLDGGNGDDRFRTRDGEVDRITCGEGDDTALLDTVDVIRDATAENPNGSCETVVRKVPKANESAPEDVQAAPAEANVTS